MLKKASLTNPKCSPVSATTSKDVAMGTRRAMPKKSSTGQSVYFPTGDSSLPATMSPSEKENGMFGKGKLVGEDWSAARVQPLQRSAIAQPAATLHPSEAISSISSEMTVVGKIICKGIIKIYGFVEGELSASNAMIADSARIDGDIVAEELTIGGRVKGNIYALRVKLRDTAVVEGDIYHRSLSIDENAWFEGWSRPEDNLPEPPSAIEVSSDLPPERQTLFAFDEKGEFEGESSGEELYQPRGRGMRVFLASCIAAIAISVVGYFTLNSMQQSAGVAYMTDGVRIDRSWIR